MTISVAEKTNAFLAGNNRACSNERNREDKCSSGKRIGIGDSGSSKKGPLCYGSGSWEELLCLLEFWAYGPLL